MKRAMSYCPPCRPAIRRAWKQCRRHLRLNARGSVIIPVFSTL
jgi:hypothetical protein